MSQRNVLRYRKRLPRGDWKLFGGPPDIYMVYLMLFRPPLASLTFSLRDSSLYSRSTSCRLSVVSSMSGGLTMGSSRGDRIAEHRASSNRSVNSEWP